MNYKRIMTALSCIGIMILAAGCTNERKEKIERDMHDGKKIEDITSCTNNMRLVLQEGKIKVYYMQHWISPWTMHTKYIVVNEETGAVSISH